MIISSRFYSSDDIDVPNLERMRGYIYLAENMWGVTKVGQTRRPKERIKLLESGGGMVIKQVHVFGPYRRYLDHERDIKELLMHKKVSGEWFAVDFDSAFNLCLNYLRENGQEIRGARQVAECFRHPFTSPRESHVPLKYPWIDQMCRLARIEAAQVTALFAHLLFKDKQLVRAYEKYMRKRTIIEVVL